MKISETTSYPYPVLAPWSDDISNASMGTEIRFREEGDENQVSIHCASALSHAGIVELVANGSAAFGCYIKCLDTGLRRLQPFGFPVGVHHFAPGALLGRVQIRPMVWAIRKIVDYRPIGMHIEFGGNFDIEPGQILAMDDEQIIDVTRSPLASIESIFEIMSSDQVPEGDFEVDTESDRITVRMSEKRYQLVQALRQTNDFTRDAVMTGLYVPVVMQVLAQLADGYEQFEQYRWLHPFRARCELEEIDIENLDLLNDAQRLLASPFDLLKRMVDDGEEMK